MKKVIFLFFITLTLLVTGCKSKPQSDLGFSFQDFEKRYNAWTKQSNQFLFQPFVPLKITKRADNNIHACMDDANCMDININKESGNISTISVRSEGIDIKSTIFQEAITGAVILPSLKSPSNEDRRIVSSFMKLYMTAQKIEDGKAQSDNSFGEYKFHFSMTKDIVTIIEISKPIVNKN